MTENTAARKGQISLARTALVLNLAALLVAVILVFWQPNTLAQSLPFLALPVGGICFAIAMIVEPRTRTYWAFQATSFAATMVAIVSLALRLRWP